MDADVVVIGAGAAGLAAARESAGRSLRAHVLEARERVGGRVWPVAFEDAAVPAELGAEFIHGQAQETAALLREAGITAIATGGDSWICSENGELQRADDDFLAEAAIFERARARENDESVDHFLRRLESEGVRRETLAAARAFVEGFDAVDPMIASAQAIADEWGSGVDLVSARPRGGYMPMFDHLYDCCVAAGVKTQFSTIVRRLSWRRGAVAVDVTNNSSKTQTIRARAAVITLPVGVLRHSGDDSTIAFDPALPAAKRAALGRIEMGEVVKVTLRFRSAFWQRIHGGRYRDAGFFRCPNGAFPTYWTRFPDRSRLIVAWAGGPKATALSGSSQEELVARALSEFGALLDELELAQTEFEAGALHNWSRDVFARGAYSYVLVGGANARSTLAAPLDDTLFFAGEATSDDGQGGTVNGALETGTRAAREVTAALEKAASA